MQRIFIDANIYIGFFNSNKPEFRKLLSSVVELQDKIIMTKQIADEIDRNKLNVFRASIENYVRQGVISSTFLPEHLDNETAGIKDWNKKRKSIEEDAKKLDTNFQNLMLDTLKKISSSTDPVSLELGKLYQKAKNHTLELLEKAINRKSIGNPPGKVNDPLGDQLSWEILLMEVKELSKLWIVTNDDDYFSEYNNHLFLNPVLYKELKERNPKLKVLLYRKLSDALRDFNKTEEIKSLPDQKELAVISMDEPEIHLHPNSKYKFFGGGRAIPYKCPYCNAIESFDNGVWHRSEAGIATVQYVCQSCNFQLSIRER